VPSATLQTWLRKELGYGGQGAERTKAVHRALSGWLLKDKSHSVARATLELGFRLVSYILPAVESQEESHCLYPKSLGKEYKVWAL
jgi:hypothetical protein